MTINSVAEGYYRIRSAGANSDIANQISNGKKCHYVQIGLELSAFASLEDAKNFVEGKGLVADANSLDFGEPATKTESEEPSNDDEALGDDSEELGDDNDETVE